MNVRGLFTTGRMTDFWNVLREVDPQHVIHEADQPLRLVICGSPGVGKRMLASTLTGGAFVGPNLSNTTIDVCDMPDDVPVALPAADLYLYVASADQQLGALQRGHLGQLAHRSGRVVCVLNSQSDHAQGDHAARSADSAVFRTNEVEYTLGISPERVFYASATDQRSIQRDLIPGLVREVPYLTLPLGRHLATARDPAADYLIADAARVNAEFAVISSLPAFVPVVGTLASVGTDMIVLTKNQVMLLLKLALLYRRPIDNRVQVFTEVMPVIGAAFFWRSAARSLSALLPGPLSIAPRGAIAYVGTYVAGKAGQYYYRWGQRPSADVLDTFRDDALRQLAGLTPLLAQVGRRLRIP